MSERDNSTVRETPVSEADQELITKKLEVIASLRELEAESARLNVEMSRRGLRFPGHACW